MIFGIDPNGIPRVCAGSVKEVIEAAERYARRHRESGPLELWEFAEPMPEGESVQ